MLTSRLAVRWAEGDGTSAMEWVRSRPPGGERDWALKETYRRWLSRDRERARAWLRAEQDDESLGVLYEGYAVNLARDDPRGAIAWVEQLADPEQRRQVQLVVGEVWLRKQPDEARPWLEANGLYAEVEAKVNYWKRPRPGSQGAAAQDPGATGAQGVAVEPPERPAGEGAGGPAAEPAPAAESPSS